MRRQAGDTAKYSHEWNQQGIPWERLTHEFMEAKDRGLELGLTLSARLTHLYSFIFKILEPPKLSISVDVFPRIFTARAQ